MKKLIIWDLDGTIVDSRLTIQTLMQKAADSMGIEPLSSDQIRAIVGLSLVRAVEVMLPDLSAPQTQEFAHHYQNHAINHYNEPGYKTPLYEGIEVLIRELKTRKVYQGLATGNSRKGVGRFLDHHDLHDHFDLIQTADDAPSKPHPQMVLAHLDHLNLTPQRAIVIGDTGHDFEMARAAGVDFIGVAHGFHTPEELKLAGAQTIAKNVPELELLIMKCLNTSDDWGNHV